MKKEKEGKDRYKNHGFLIQNILSHPLSVYKRSYRKIIIWKAQGVPQ